MSPLERCSEKHSSSQKPQASWSSRKCRSHVGWAKYFSGLYGLQRNKGFTWIQAWLKYVTRRIIFSSPRITHIAAGESQKQTHPEMTSQKLQLTIQLLIRNIGLLCVLPTNTIQENQKVGSIYGEQSKEGYNKNFILPHSYIWHQNLA